MVMLKKDDILRGLRKIDAMAEQAGVVVDLSIYGGAALALAFDIRHATRDVDAVVHGSPNFLRGAAVEVAHEEGWPEDWLNDGVKGFTSDKEQMSLMGAFEASPTGGLRIHLPSPEYLFAMKCMSMRPEGINGSHDISDIEALADEAGIKDSETALSLVEAFYPSARIPPKVRFGVEEIMERLVLRHTEESREREHRLATLPDLKDAGGATYTFWRLASDALRHANGDALVVDWKKVEDATIIESIGEHQQSPESVRDILCKHSPGAVTYTQQQTLRESIERAARLLQPETFSLAEFLEANRFTVDPLKATASYIGAVLWMDGDQAVQSLGRGHVVIHEVSNWPVKPEISKESCTIDYKNGKPSMEPPEPEHDRPTLGR
jgi:hypothetical protein